MTSIKPKTACWLSFILGTGQILTWGMTYYLPAMLFDPLMAELNWGKEEIFTAFSLALFVSGLCAPFIGKAIVRYTGKRVLVTGNLLNAVGLLILAITTQYYQFIIAWAFLGAGMAASLYAVAFSILGQVDGVNARKSITTITLLGGFASTIAWPFGAYFIACFGWRELCFFYAFITLIMVLPLYGFFLSIQNTNPIKNAGKTRPALQNQINGNRKFIMFTLSIMIFAFINAALSLFLITVLIDAGQSALLAAGLAALLAPSQVAARILERIGSTKFSPLWTLLLANLLLMFGAVLIMIGQYVIIYGVVAFGAGKGLISIAKGSVPLALFGPHNYAIKLGHIERYAMFTQALSPAISGWVYISFGALGLLILLLILSALALPLCLLLLGSADTNGSH